MPIIDLTMPITDHFRWPVERSLKSSFETGDMAQVTHMGWAVHGFTHVDAPRHMFPEGPTTSDTKLDQIVGQAAVVDLSGIVPETPITEA
ncbi:MAG: cyclase family protein, partial [Gemmatimonadota bacterium]|nr:cyclase family protein [Gemmatimonadota bacterium]